MKFPSMLHWSCMVRPSKDYYAPTEEHGSRDANGSSMPANAAPGPDALCCLDGARPKSQKAPTTPTSSAAADTILHAHSAPAAMFTIPEAQLHKYAALQPYTSGQRHSGVLSPHNCHHAQRPEVISDCGHIFSQAAAAVPAAAAAPTAAAALPAWTHGMYPFCNGSSSGTATAPDTEQHSNRQCYAAEDAPAAEDADDGSSTTTTSSSVDSLAMPFSPFQQLAAQYSMDDSMTSDLAVHLVEDDGNDTLNGSDDNSSICTGADGEDSAAGSMSDDGSNASATHSRSDQQQQAPRPRPDAAREAAHKLLQTKLRTASNLNNHCGGGSASLSSSLIRHIATKHLRQHQDLLRQQQQQEEEQQNTNDNDTQRAGAGRMRRAIDQNSSNKLMSDWPDCSFLDSPRSSSGGGGARHNKGTIPAPRISHGFMNDDAPIRGYYMNSPPRSRVTRSGI